MTGIVKLSEPALLGLHAMALLADRHGKVVSTREIARKYKASEHHLAKIMRKLSRADLVKTTRGPHGGYSLARTPARINLLQIYETVEGKYRHTKCLMHIKCPREGCLLGGNIERISRELRTYLHDTTLEDLRENESGGKK